MARILLSLVFPEGPAIRVRLSSPVTRHSKPQLNCVPQAECMSEVKPSIPTLEEVGVSILAPIPEGPPDLIPGFLPLKGQLIIAGETNVGKSLIALETISSLVTGNPLWGELAPAKKINKVLYLLGEHYVEVIQRLHQKTGLPMTDKVFVVGPEQLSFDKWLVVSGRPNPAAIQRYMKWAEGCDLIVFDPLSAFVCGSDVENDNAQMRLVLDTMSLISQQAGASSIILAHQGKPTVDNFGKEHSRTRYAIRGASAIEDAATNIIYMGRADSEIASKVGSDGPVFELKVRKFKGEAPSEYRLVRNPTTLTHTLLGHKPFSEVMRSQARTKIARLQETMPELTYRSAIKILAAVDGVSELTIKRHLGLSEGE